MAGEFGVNGLGYNSFSEMDSSDAFGDLTIRNDQFELIEEAPAIDAGIVTDFAPGMSELSFDEPVEPVDKVDVSSVARDTISRIMDEYHIDGIDVDDFVSFVSARLS